MYKSYLRNHKMKLIYPPAWIANSLNQNFFKCYKNNIISLQNLMKMFVRRTSAVILLVISPVI
jgi:hypothetical protein